jgi:dTDP-4-amino-4,6-dideoxygalactose transaminase
VNGQYLATRLSKLPGLHPQKRIKECARHSYHLFMMRVVEEEFGISRATVLKALQAEGIPCSGGYAISLPEQPLFRNKAFAPYLPVISKKLNFAKTHVPNSDLICSEQGMWLEQSIFLGPREDMDDIASAFEKVYENRAELKKL